MTTVDSSQTLGDRRPTTTWALQTGRDQGDRTRAPALTGETTSRVDVDRRTLMEARTSMAEERRAGDLDLDQDTRVEEGEDTGGGGTEEEEGTQGTGAPRRGSPEESSEDGETRGEQPDILKTCRPSEVWTRHELDSLVVSGSEEEAPAGPELEITPTSTAARRRASMVLRRWAEAGTTGAEGGHLEEEVHPEEVRASGSM